MRLISYTIKPDLTEQNRSMISGVFETLHEQRPTDLRYTVLETGDGRFLHLAESTESSSHVGRADHRNIVGRAERGFLRVGDAHSSGPNTRSKIASTCFR